MKQHSQQKRGEPDKVPVTCPSNVQSGAKFGTADKNILTEILIICYYLFLVLFVISFILYTLRISIYNGNYKCGLSEDEFCTQETTDVFGLVTSILLIIVIFLSMIIILIRLFEIENLWREHDNNRRKIK